MTSLGLPSGQGSRCGSGSLFCAVFLAQKDFCHQCNEQSLRAELGLHTGVSLTWQHFPPVFLLTASLSLCPAYSRFGAGNGRLEGASLYKKHLSKYGCRYIQSSPTAEDVLLPPVLFTFYFFLLVYFFCLVLFAKGFAWQLSVTWAAAPCKRGSFTQGIITW